MLRRMAAEKTVDIFGYVMSLRRDRNFMVQNEEQYVLIHDVLVEDIHSGLTETRASGTCFRCPCTFPSIPSII